VWIDTKSHFSLNMWKLNPKTWAKNDIFLNPFLQITPGPQTTYTGFLIFLEKDKSTGNSSVFHWKSFCPSTNLTKNVRKWKR